MMIRKNDISIGIAEAARRAWERGAEFRSRRERYKRFTYGDQWNDIVTEPDGEKMTARQQALKHGKEPMTNNLIRRMVKCVIGRFRMWIDETDAAARGEYLEKVYRENSLDEMDCRALEEFLISGMAVQRVSDEVRPGRKGTRVDNVSPVRFFVNSFTDPRGDDIEMVGMLHDMSPGEAVMRFAGGSRKKAKALRELLGRQEERYGESLLGRSVTDSESFSHCGERGRCRLIEVWTLESHETVRWHDPAGGACGEVSNERAGWIDSENKSRAASGARLIDHVLTHSIRWYCRWMTPDGSVVSEYESPHAHGSHPFVVKMYPLTDGEVHSLVEDVIDQQIYVNRLITLMDRVMSTSAKGVLLFPKSQRSSNMDWEKLSALWASPDGVIPYEAVDGAPEPRQLITNAGDFGARELLSLELQMLEDVSGVSNALLGRSSGGGNVGYERYESEVRNATVAINDLLLTFVHFREERDEKLRGI
ncbi:MAG: hypothetical protein K2G06_09680 [Muribaculaceae bacterium]|nr:hypothetical protein [Muribaculaceae bacterium]